MTVRTKTGNHVFNVEISDSPEEKSKGLMFRTDLKDDQGMLFLWEMDTQGAFWMKNTPLSLDILFIDSNKRVIYVAENAVPYSTDPIQPNRPYRFVLEVRGGFAQKSGLTLGDSLEISY